MGLLSSRKQAPASVPTDLVIELPFWDNQDYARGICLDFTFKFNDVLDPERLRDSLDTLLRKDGWRKFGARLRKNENNQLEYHIPEEFDAKRPAFLFSVDKHDTPVSEHPAFSQLTLSTPEKPATFDIFSSLRYELRSSETPEVIDGWLESDAPQLAVHVVVFEDATFLTVTFMHTLMDAMGLSALLKGWSAVMRGQEDEIPPVVGIEVDPRAKLDQMTPASKYVLANKALQGLGFFWFVVNYVFGLLWYRKDEGRIVCVPGDYLKTMRDTVLAELSEEFKDDDDDKRKPPFVSESDVLVSWWTHVLFKALNMSPKQAITLMNVFDTRAVLAEADLIPSANTAFIANATWPTIILTTVGDVLGKPISYLASCVRQAIDSHRTVEQVQAIASTLRESVDKLGRPAVFGDRGATTLLTYSNWHRAKLYQTDFSAAVVKEGIPVSERSNLTGRPAFALSSGKFNGFSPRNAIAVVGKDSAGNWWLGGHLRAGVWGRIEEQLSSKQ